MERLHLGHIQQITRGAQIPLQARRGSLNFRVARLFHRVSRPNKYQQRIRLGHEGGPGTLPEPIELHANSLDSGLRPW